MAPRDATWTRLKWLTIVLPVAFVGLLHYLLHTTLYEFHDFPAVLVLLVPVLASIGAFSFGVFGIVSVLERRLESKNRELEALLAVGTASASAPELPDLLDSSLAAVVEVTPADVAEIWFEEDGALTLAARTGFAPADRDRPFADRLALRDIAEAPVAAESALIGAGYRAACALPLRHGTETVGVLALAAHGDTELCAAWDARSRLLEGIAERLAVAIENARLHAQVLDSAVIEERTRIGRELHDSLGQLLGYLNTQTLAVRKLLASGRSTEAQTELAAMDAATRQLYTDLRVAIAGLRALRHPEHLATSLPRYARTFQELTGASITVHVSDEAAGIRLPPYADLQLMRIVQEALSNVKKHAGSNAATIDVAVGDGRLTLSVADRGRGFDVGRARATPSPSFGLETMRERAESIGGSLMISSEGGDGTLVTVDVPLAPARNGQPGHERGELHASAAR